MTELTTPKFTEQQVLEALKAHYQLSGQLKHLPGYCDQNFMLTTATSRFIVKIANNEESLQSLEMQNAAMGHLYNTHCKVPHVIPANSQQDIVVINDENNTPFRLRVLSYLTGEFFVDVEKQSITTPFWHKLGEFLGELNDQLSHFTHLGAYRYLEWDLAQGYPICMMKKTLLAPEDKALVEYFLSTYASQIMPILDQLPKAIIHNDANDHNLLVNSKNNPTDIAGLIDFGDMVYSHIINELAIGCAYSLMNVDDTIEALVAIVKGYNEKRPLSALEIKALYPLITLRLCTTLSNAALAIKETPDNEYLNISVAPARQLLIKLKQYDAIAVETQLLHACGHRFDHGRSKEDIIAFRQKHLGKTLSLNYQAPLKIVRGKGAYLYDEQGNAYLDMVNNVCHVGHCHPHVVEAGQRQMALLNTNTRYLHDNIVNYSEKLLATLPQELSVCMLVNSGSEANELAFRLAKNYTGSKQLLTVEGAYHGNTNACIEASPYKFDGPGGQGAPDYVHKVSLPDPYRGKYQGASSARQYADDVASVIEKVHQRGEKIGAFICESLQGVAGQIIMPKGYLQLAYQHVRAAGGVCIADEVQVGFGRCGHHMWAFESQYVIPDIVTVGKPIGNGHPMAAVITTQAIADAFVNGMEYFNTFGGNPVSCAIGEAVLDVIHNEKLQENALVVGNYLMAGLKSLQAAYPIIGDVRGLGLFIGVELVTDRQSKTPATETTAKLVEFAKQHQILLSTEGKFYNILKIKPPIVFSHQDADKFLNMLDKGLSQLTQ
ncbi:aminotransferase class III-fold pyridoxal phosphate-dependent enzyme [Thalassotalea ganghwensis]